MKKYNNIEESKKFLLCFNVVSGSAVKASPLGRLVGLLFFIFMSVISYAQPLPPTTPSGNPVPIANLAYLLPFAMILFGIYKLRKRKR